MFRRGLAFASTVFLVAACGAGDSADTADATPAPAEVAMAEASNPRFGAWKIRSDNPPPSSNIMTYEPWGDGGMKITIVAVNADSDTTTWGYTTLFDGEFTPQFGREGTESAVEVIDEFTNLITNRTGDRDQTIVNVLSADGNTIENEYRRTNADGEESVSYATYERIR